MGMNVVEMFLSIDGEGKRSGKPTIFIRTLGCNLHCSYCDSTYACDLNEAKEYGLKSMKVHDIINHILKSWPGIKSVTLTGGEPLMFLKGDISDLIYRLNSLGFDVNIETNGSFSIERVKKCTNVWVTMDYKCPSSGMEDYMLKENLYILDENDVLKFVVGDENDLNTMLNVIRTYNPKSQVYVSPVFGKIEPKDIVSFILKYPELKDVRVQVQLHKLVWDPQEKGV